MALETWKPPLATKLLGVSVSIDIGTEGMPDLFICPVFFLQTKEKLFDK